MSTRQPEDQLAAALTNLGRSVEIWADLAASGADCTTMKSLIRQNAWTLESSESICASKINSQLLQRLAVIGERSQYLEGEDTYQDSATTSAITTLSVRLFKEKMVSHKSYCGLPGEYEKSELDQLQDLKERLEIQDLMKSQSDSFSNPEAFLRSLNRIITYDLTKLHLSIETEERSPSLDILELGASIGKDLSGTQQTLLDRFLEQKIGALKVSSAVTADVQNTPVNDQPVMANGWTSNQPCASITAQVKPDTLHERPFDPINASNVNDEMRELQQKLEDLEGKARILEQDKRDLALSNSQFISDNMQKLSLIKKLKTEKGQVNEKLVNEQTAYASVCAHFPYLTCKSLANILTIAAGSLPGRIGRLRGCKGRGDEAEGTTRRRRGRPKGISKGNQNASRQ